MIRKGSEILKMWLILLENSTEASMPFPFQGVFCILDFPFLYILTNLRYISSPALLHITLSPLSSKEKATEPNLLSVTFINPDISNRHPTLQSIRRLTIWRTRIITSHSDIQDRKKFPMGHVLPLHAPIRFP